MAVSVGVQAAGAATTATDAADPGLEKIVRPHLALPDFGLWREAMTRVEGQVCRITLNGNAQGTGFLVGPDAVLTNYHVMKPVIDNRGPARRRRMSIRFQAAERRHRPLYSGQAGRRLADRLQPILDGRNSTAPRTPRRPRRTSWTTPWSGWPTRSGRSRGPSRPTRVATPRTAAGCGCPTPPRRSPPYTPVIIAQHPDGQPMKLALDTDAIDQAKGVLAERPRHPGAVRDQHRRRVERIALLRLRLATDRAAPLRRPEEQRNATCSDSGITTRASPSA